MIKAVFIDIDGTLLSHSQGKVPESARRALRKLRARGIKIYTATGRHPIELARLPLQGIDFDAEVLVNGALVLDKDGKIISRHPLPEAAMDILRRDFAAREHSLMFVEKDRMYVNCVLPETEQAQASISTPVPPVSDYRGADVYQAVIYGEGPGQVYKEELPGCELTRWHSGAWDIISAEAGKDSGIAALLRHEGILMEEVLALGDGENDASMLASAGIGVAMGNAAPKAKEKADWTAPHIDEDGLARALLHFKLIDEL